MKNRNLIHSDNWATPPYLYEELDKEFSFDFDPCPFMHGMEWDGLEVEWGSCNFVNPPYSRGLKDAFIKKAVSESMLGNTCVCLIPASTSTSLFHDWILPNKREIRFLRGRIPFIGINTKGEYVNWHLWDRIPPDGVVHVKNNGMHDSMIVVL